MTNDVFSFKLKPRMKKRRYSWWRAIKYLRMVTPWALTIPCCRPLTCWTAGEYIPPEVRSQLPAQCTPSLYRRSDAFSCSHLLHHNKWYKEWEHEKGRFIMHHNKQSTMQKTKVLVLVDKNILVYILMEKKMWKCLFPVSWEGRDFCHKAVAKFLSST